MKRAKHTLSHYKLATGNMGDLLPVACVPILPGDSLQMSTSALIRFSPLNTPVMHPTQVRIHHFFVPNRIVWSDWEDFITGGISGDDPAVIPRATSDGQKDRVSAYQGVAPLSGFEFNALALRGYNKIWNEFYRDQDLMTESAEHSDVIRPIAWEKDYFSTARPWTQRGPDVVVPIGDRAPVYHNAGGGTEQVTVMDDQASEQWVRLLGTPNVTTGPGDQDETDRLYADLTSATGVEVNAFREAFALQRYQEARARYGARFTEYLRYLGITPSDARLQRPEYLGGGTARVQFSEVLQTAESGQEAGDRSGLGVGDLYGHGISGARTNRFRKFFEEHGYVHTLLSVRPKTLYVNSTQKEFLKTTKEDFFQKELVHLGQQEILDSELYPNANNDPLVFGFQDRYHEYRSHPSHVCGDFRDTLNAYHMGRDLAQRPVLNEDFIECVPSDRIFQVDSSQGDTIWAMVNNHIVARRLVPKVARPKIL